MRNNLNLIMLFCLFMLCSQQVLANEQVEQKNKVTSLSIDIAQKIVTNQLGVIKLNGMKKNTLELYNGQYFGINIKSKTFYILSTMRTSLPDDLPMCTVLLFDNSKNFINAVDILGPNDDRPWTCDGTKAMSFSDYYPDGSLRIIALYNVTPPSNERFVLPIVIKMDHKNPSLLIDEILTSKLDDKDITTIKAARALLKNIQQN